MLHFVGKISYSFWRFMKLIKPPMLEPWPVLDPIAKIIYN